MRLRALREDQDLTQKAVADYLHIRQNTYSQYETGQRQLPLELLVALALYYHTSTIIFWSSPTSGNPIRKSAGEFSVAKAPFPSSGSAGRKGGFLAYGGSTAGFTALPAGLLSFAGIPHLLGCPGHGAWPAVQ